MRRYIIIKSKSVTKEIFEKYGKAIVCIYKEIGDDAIETDFCVITFIGKPIYHLERYRVLTKEQLLIERIKIINDKVPDIFNHDISLPSPFANSDGYSFSGMGTSGTAESGETIFDLVIEDNTEYRYNGIEILGGELGDAVDLQIIDSDGSYVSKNFILNEFATDWNVKPDLVKVLLYSSLLKEKMAIRVVYKNNGQAKTIYINHDLHEVV